MGLKTTYLIDLYDLNQLQIHHDLQKKSCLDKFTVLYLQNILNL
jgi:hypothetical protein